MGGQSNAGTAGAPAHYRTFCWDWSDLENEPEPGQSGIDACPAFNEVKFVIKYTCFYDVPDPTPIPPDATATGDCCYAVTDYNCR
jgi:hypothetical protein